MKAKEFSEYHSLEDADLAIRAIVRAAAKTLPVPLKAIPKKNGGKRKLRKPTDSPRGARTAK